MKRLLSYLWLPLLAALSLLFIYGGLTITDLKLKNQNLGQKQKQLEERLTRLENGLDQVQVAASKEEKPTWNKRILAAITPTPTPAFSPTPEKTLVPSTPRPTPTSQPSPSATPTPLEQAKVIIENLGTYTVNLEADDTALDILVRAGSENGFAIELQTYEGLGAFVNCIGGICTHDNYYWAFYLNGSYSMVGASAQPVSEGDETAWKFESF